LHGDASALRSAMATARFAFCWPNNVFAKALNRPLWVMLLIINSLLFLNDVVIRVSALG